MATDSTSGSRGDNPSPETKIKSVKNYAITPRVILEIVHGDPNARDLLLNGDHLDLHFYIAETIVEDLKNYLNALIKAHEISFVYARHLYRILVEHAIPVAGKKPRLDHPLELVHKEEFRPLGKEAQDITLENHNPVPVQVALCKGKEVNIWVGKFRALSPLKVNAPVATITTQDLEDAIKAKKDELLLTAKINQIATRQRIITRILLAPAEAVSTTPTELPVKTTGPALNQYAAGLGAILEPKTFEPASVTWALEHVGFFTGEELMTPAFLRDLPKAETVEDVGYFTFFYKPEKLEDSAKVEIVHLLPQLARYEDLFIEPMKAPDLGEYYNAALIWNTSEKAKKIEGRVEAIPGRQEHRIYWKNSAKHWGNYPPKQGPEDPAFTRDFDTTFKPDNPPNVPLNDPPLAIFLTGDIIDHALAARDKAVDAYYTQYWISLKDFVDTYHLPITIERLGECNLWLKVVYRDRKGAPTGKTTVPLLEAYYRLAEFLAYIRQMDRTYPLRVAQRKLKLNRSQSEQIKQQRMSWLKEAIEEENRKATNLEGQL